MAWVERLGRRCFSLAEALQLPTCGLPNTPLVRRDSGCLHVPMDFSCKHVPPSFVLPKALALHAHRPGIMNTTEHSQSISAIRLAESTSQPVLAVYPAGPAVLFMPGGKRQRSYGNYPCYAHPITTEADVNSLHMLVAGVLRGDSKVVTVMIDMRGDLPLDWNSRVSPIFFTNSGVGTVRTAGSWLTMQPVSPRVVTLLAALEPRMLRPGAVEYPRASKAEVTMFRDLLSEYLRESSKFYKYNL